MKIMILAMAFVFCHSVGNANIRLILNGGGSAEMMAMRTAESLPKLLQLAATNPFLFEMNRTDQLHLEYLLQYFEMTKNSEEPIPLSGSDFYDSNELPKSQAAMLEILFHRLLEGILGKAQRLAALSPSPSQALIAQQLMEWYNQGIYSQQTRRLASMLFANTSPEVDIFQNSRANSRANSHKSEDGVKVTILKIKNQSEVYLQMNGHETRITSLMLAAIQEQVQDLGIAKNLELRNVQMIDRNSNVLAVKIEAESPSGQKIFATVGLHPIPEFFGFNVNIAVAGIRLGNHQTSQCADSVSSKKKEF